MSELGRLRSCEHLIRRLLPGWGGRTFPLTPLGFEGLYLCLEVPHEHRLVWVLGRHQHVHAQHTVQLETMQLLLEDFDLNK